MVWDERKIKTLKDHYLGKLINPNQDYLKEEQKITLSLLCPDFTRLSGEIKNRVFEKLNYRTTSIEAMTHYDEAKKELYITTILRHKGKDILRIVEKNNRFELLKKVKIVLFYLNPYSKARFKEEQGMRSIEYGSIFLFLNGFRVSPYGDKGNDWLGLEERKAQGQRRYLSGRDMVGRIEITDFSGTFKPVSSREGIVKNEAFLLLTKVKMNDNEGDRNDDKKEYENEADKKGFGLVLETVRSFERYVVEGLNWDSGVSLQYVQEFENKIKNGEAIDELYSESDTEKDRKCLEAVRSIIQNRSGDITALTIDKEFIGQLLDSEEEKNKQLLKQLEKYTGTFTEDTREAIDKIQKTLKAKEAELERQRQQLAEAERKRIDAEMRAAQEQKKRAEAEAVARKAEAKSKEDENKRKEAELKQREAESRRKEADLKRQEADKKRAEAELNQRASEMKRKEAEFQQQTELRKRKEAELMQREEENKRKEAELKQREAENLRKEADFKAAQEKIAKEKAQKEAAEKQNQLKVEQSKNIYLLSQRRFNDDVEGLIHHISILLGKARSKMDELVKTLRKQGDLTPYLADEITELRLLVEKTTTISKLITRAGFKKDEDKQIINICDYFQQYIGIYKQIYTNGLVKDIGISFISNGFSINKKVSPLELSIVIDNLIDNAQKFQAKNIVFEVVKYNTLTRDVKIWVYDDGIGLATQFLEYPNQIFELGITTTYGSGIGLHFVKNIMKNEQNINGSITFVGNNVKLKGACFELTFG
jgi:signal transduction histidine kinase